MRIAQRIPGIGDEPESREAVVARKTSREVRRVHAVLLADHRFAGGARKGVVEVLDDAAVDVEGEHPQPRRGCRNRQRDEREVGAEDARERSDERAEDVLVGNGRDREGGRAHRLALREDALRRARFRPRRFRTQPGIVIRMQRALHLAKCTSAQRRSAARLRAGYK